MSMQHMHDITCDAIDANNIISKSNQWGVRTAPDENNTVALSKVLWGMGYPKRTPQGGGHLYRTNSLPHFSSQPAGVEKFSLFSFPPLPLQVALRSMHAISPANEALRI